MSKSSALKNDLEHYQERQDALLSKLPPRLGRFVKKLLEPQRKKLRIALGIFFILAGIFSFLPVLGLWMLPLGMILLAQDNKFCRNLSARLLGWAAKHHPEWFDDEKKDAKKIAGHEGDEKDPTPLSP